MPVNEVTPVTTDVFTVSDAGEVDLCGVLISQTVLKTMWQSLQVNSFSLIVKITGDDIMMFV